MQCQSAHQRLKRVRGPARTIHGCHPGYLYLVVGPAGQHGTGDGPHTHSAYTENEKQQAGAEKSQNMFGAECTRK